MDALAFIEKDGHTRRQPYYILSGDEDFLKRLVLDLLGPLVLGDTDPQYATTIYNGEETEYSTVRNELDSVSFFSERRLVVVTHADEFVSKYRPDLEKYVANPSVVGVLVLDVKTLPPTTKLAKAVPESCHIVCKAPKEYQLGKWCSDWCHSRYGKKLPSTAAELLVALVGPTMGVLDQELQKLSDFVGERSAIDVKDVDDLVGQSRGANIFKIMEAIGDQQPHMAIRILEEVLDAGEPTMKVLYALAAQLRKLAKIARLHQQGLTLNDATAAAGVASYFRDATQRQLRHLGMSRLDRLYDWVLELEQHLKGGSQLPERVLLERFIVRLARPRT